MIDAPNLPRIIAAALGTGKATLHELETYYSAEDAYLIVEVAAVDSYNSYLVNKEQAARNANR